MKTKMERLREMFFNMSLPAAIEVAGSLPEAGDALTKQISNLSREIEDVRERLTLLEEAAKTERRALWDNIVERWSGKEIVKSLFGS